MNASSASTRSMPLPGTRYAAPMRASNENGWSASPPCFRGVGDVLDLGCGAGQPVARWLVERGFRVTGIRPSPSLITICRERFPEAAWQVADMRQMALGERFDGLIAWHSLFHLTPDDQRPLFPRLAAHAGPGAILMFTSGWGEGVRIGEWQGEPLYHASLDPDEYRRLLADNGFELLEHQLRDPDCGESTIWIARFRD